MARSSHSLKITPHPTEQDCYYVNSHQISCDGNNGALGHPKVYLEVEENGEIVCPYCSKKFIHKH